MTKLIKLPEGFIITSKEISGFENNVLVYNNGRIWRWDPTMALRSDNKPKLIIASTFHLVLPQINFNGFHLKTNYDFKKLSNKRFTIEDMKECFLNARKEELICNLGGCKHELVYPTFEDYIMNLLKLDTIQEFDVVVGKEERDEVRIIKLLSNG